MLTHLIYQIRSAVSDLASLKAEVDKKAVDKLKTIPADLTELNNIAGTV